MKIAASRQEQQVFAGAANAFAALPGNEQSITDMMRLALEGFCPSIRRRASEWLFRHVGVKVVDIGGQHATEAATASLR